MVKDRDVRLYRAGDSIMAEGDTGREIFILLSGSVSIWRGRSELGRLSGVGDVIGELAALSGRPRSATVLAVTDAQLIVIPLDMAEVCRRQPEIMQKIATAIKMRFEIARNKAKMYSSEASLARRMILHEAMVRRELERDKRLCSKEAAVRKKMRQNLDDSLERYGENDDPRLLRKVADDLQILTDYMKDIGSRPWLDEALALRLIEIDDRYRLATNLSGLALLKEEALLTIEAIDLLAEYESLPGAVKVMDRARLEDVIPHAEKLKALKAAVRTKEGDIDEKRSAYLDRKILDTIENLKMSAGRDPIQFYHAASLFGVESEYEKELRHTMERADTSSTFLDLASLHPYP